MSNENKIIDADSYKASHWQQYPTGTTKTFSYLEARGSTRNYNETVFFGLQYILKRYFSNPITDADVKEAGALIEAHGEPFNWNGWYHIVEDHHGHLPLKIRAVLEGSIVPTHLPLMTVETTCPKCYWVASYFETALMRVWYPITVATQSYYLKKLIYKYLKQTSDDADAEIDFKLHDFGSRGVSSQESAGLGGLAHLVNFKGTDTMQALLIGQRYYNEPMAGFSIPAGEHSTFSSWGRDGEVTAYRNMLKTFGKPNALLAVVSDTWNIYNACEKIWGEELRQEVIDSGATVVIRPDSGDPVDVLCGKGKSDVIDLSEYDEEGWTVEHTLDMETGDVDITYGETETRTYLIQGEYYEVTFRVGDLIEAHYDGNIYETEYDFVKVEVTPESKGILQILAEKFGYTTNSKGFKVLNHVRVIQGDGVNPNSIEKILSTMKSLGFSASNIAFGMGGALLQKVDRDTMKMAYKCSSATINGVETDVYKDPITDSGKRSKKGRLDLIMKDGNYETFQLTDNASKHIDSVMFCYYENGHLLMDDTLEEIRSRASLTKTPKRATIGK